MASADKKTAPHIQLLHRWKQYLLQPVDGASLAAFRVLFGIMMVADLVRYYHYDWIGALYVTPQFHFTYPFFGFIRPWPDDLMYLHFFLMGVLALLIVLGLFYRAAAVLFFLSFSYVFLLDMAYYLNHFYLIVLLSFILVFVPANRVASLDKRWFSKHTSSTVPFWSLFLVRSQLFIVYFFGGVAKLNSDWLQGEPVRMWLANRTDFPLIGGYFTQEWAVYFFAYGGLLFDLGIGFLLILKRTRVFALFMAIVFHFLNSQLFLIGIFPSLMMAATLIFAEPDWPRRLGCELRRWLTRRSWLFYYDGECRFCKKAVQWLNSLDLLGGVQWRAYQECKALPADLSWEELERSAYLISGAGVPYEGFYAFRMLTLRLPPLLPLAPFLWIPGVDIAGVRLYRWIARNRQRIGTRRTDRGGGARRRAPRVASRQPASGSANREPRFLESGHRTWPILLFLHIYLFIQVLLPLRHWLYPGNVNWTEEGQFFAWHMKLRDKKAHLRMQITDGMTGETWEVDRAPDLAPWQGFAMLHAPDLVLQYVHHIRDRLKEGGMEQPIIKVDLMVSLNGRPHQPLLDPEVNLAEEKWTLGHADWILPLADR